MNSRKIITFIIISVLIFGADFNVGYRGLQANWSPKMVQAATSLSGRFLLQVQAKGQAWYLNPVNHHRYLITNNIAGLAVLRNLGLGASNKDWRTWQSAAPHRLAGRFLIKVQDKGQLYYLSPVNFKLYSLANAQDLVQLIKQQGLGISNQNLQHWPIGTSSQTLIGVSSKNTSSVSSSSVPAMTPTVPLSAVATDGLKHFTFKYQNYPYDISEQLSPTMLANYQSSLKVYSYTGNPSQTELREAFYGLFFQTKAGDQSIPELVRNLRSVAAQNNWTSDQLLEFSVALVQYLPYDHAKLADNANRNLNPYYPYETLYLGRGVCSDKTFLAVAILRQLGYGAAILDFPDINHSALGVACPVQYSLNGSGYCYAETTNYFPIGIIPQAISGQAQAVTDQLAAAFTSTNLGQVEIYQSTKGLVYQGVSATRNKVSSLQTAQVNIVAQQKTLDTLLAGVNQQGAALTQLKAQMDSYANSGQTAQYNSLVMTYNSQVATYNAAVTDYRSKTEQYNQSVANFNQTINDFYQK
jgi:hypothetical protein